jgi:hypothetical protein
MTNKSNSLPQYRNYQTMQPIQQFTTVYNNFAMARSVHNVLLGTERQHDIDDTDTIDTKILDHGAGIFGMKH